MSKVFTQTKTLTFYSSQTALQAYAMHDSKLYSLSYEGNGVRLVISNKGLITDKVVVYLDRLVQEYGQVESLTKALEVAEQHATSGWSKLKKLASIF